MGTRPRPPWPRRRRKIRFAGFFCPTFASIARKPVAWRRVRPDRLCARRSAPFWCKTMFVTAAGTASFRVLLASSIDARNRSPMPAARSNAPFAMIDKRAALSRPAPRFVRRSRSFLVVSTICERAERSAFGSYKTMVTATRSFTIRWKPRCAAFTPSSCSWASLTIMGCRRSRKFQQFT